MRWLILNVDYRAFSNWLYDSQPGLQERTYDEQYRARMDTFFGTADFYSSNLQKQGDEAWDVIVNEEGMQMTWAAENGFFFRKKKNWRFRLRRNIVPWLYRDDSSWMNRILESQIKWYRPDVLYSMALGLVGSDVLRRVKGYYRIAIGQHASPIPSNDISEYDLVLSSLPNQVEYFKKNGLKSELFRLGFEPRVLDHLNSEKKQYDCAFVGGLGNVHAGGIKTLDLLSTSNLITVWGYGIEGLPNNSAIRRRYRGPAWGKIMFQILNDSKIAFNRHIDVADGYANNMRLYEATGVGTMLLTDEKTNLSDIFEPGKEVVTYRSPAECLELVAYYLQHDKEREAIALAGHQRTMREHTYFNRMEELHEIVRKYL